MMSNEIPQGACNPQPRVVILVEIKGVFARMQVNTAVGKLCHQLITQ